MTNRYQPNMYRGCAAFNPSLCVAAVRGSGRWPTRRQCTRKPRDGSEWCGTHEPERRRKRQEDRDEARRKGDEAIRNMRRASRILAGLADATVEQLRAELAKRGEA